MSPHAEGQDDRPISPPQTGKDEMNFAEFPIALLTDRVPRGQKSIKFEDQIYDERRKKVIIRRRIIEGSEEYGLPTATDDAVVLALIQLTKTKSDFASREVEFTRMELLRLLGWADEGRNFERIKLSLLRIANVTYTYDNAWWDGRLRRWTTKAFHIIDTVEINDGRAASGQVGPSPSRVVWGEVVFESFQSGFLRNIDFQLCMRLEHPTAVRMYRFLGKRFHVRPDWAFDLREFAHEHVGLGRNYEGGTQIIRKLRPAVVELERVGFLEPLAEADRYLKKGREWSIRFLQAGATPSLSSPEAEAEVGPADATTSELASRLAERGVTRATAVELAREHPERVDRQVAYFDWMTAAKPEKIGEPGGYLADAIKKDYAAPRGFIDPAERERQVAARRAKEHEDARALRAERDRKARQKSEAGAVAAFWAALTPEQQDELQAAADAQADPETLAAEAGPLRRMGRTIRREAYIRRILAERETAREPG